MSKLNNRYWLETEHFFNNHSSPESTNSPYHDTKSQTRLSRFEIFPENKMFCNKPTPLHLTQYPDLFVTYTEGFNTPLGEIPQCFKICIWFPRHVYKDMVLFSAYVLRAIRISR